MADSCAEVWLLLAGDAGAKRHCLAKRGPWAQADQHAQDNRPACTQPDIAAANVPAAVVVPALPALMMPCSSACDAEAAAWCPSTTSTPSAGACGTSAHPLPGSFNSTSGQQQCALPPLGHHNAAHITAYLEPSGSLPLPRSLRDQGASHYSSSGGRYGSSGSGSSGGGGATAITSHTMVVSDHAVQVGADMGAGAGGGGPVGGDGAEMCAQTKQRLVRVLLRIWPLASATAAAAAAQQQQQQQQQQQHVDCADQHMAAGSAHITGTATAPAATAAAAAAAVSMALLEPATPPQEDRVFIRGAGASSVQAPAVGAAAPPAAGGSAAVANSRKRAWDQVQREEQQEPPPQQVQDMIQVSVSCDAPAPPDVSLSAHASVPQLPQQPSSVRRLEAEGLLLPAGRLDRLMAASPPHQAVAPEAAAAGGGGPAECAQQQQPRGTAGAYSDAVEGVDDLDLLQLALAPAASACGASSAAATVTAALRVDAAPYLEQDGSARQGTILQAAVELIRVVEVRGGVSVRAPWTADGGPAAAGSSTNTSTGSPYFCAACVAAAASGSSTTPGLQQQLQQARRRPARVLPLEAAMKLLVAYGSAARALYEAEARQLDAEVAEGGSSSSSHSGVGSSGNSGSSSDCTVSGRHAALVPLMRRGRRGADQLLAQVERAVYGKPFVCVGCGQQPDG
ncbi:hypothetical protein HXX76_011887 [Chlamydomonas incerta]|uniref:Uncharacterized protein n=1 Tax=Chlamydomonas incerta TaxID=51695 RepID=A0A835SN94_CHLIN|nr:hypothetical protein HXX76_011887 [Chlamydomonas incerta]|eukprot:KAG2428207.1 hypothetical protein HXX76_011887 [Chlamydomonas incerta]